MALPKPPRDRALKITAASLPQSIHRASDIDRSSFPARSLLAPQPDRPTDLPAIPNLVLLPTLAICILFLFLRLFPSFPVSSFHEYPIPICCLLLPPSPRQASPFIRSSAVHPRLAINARFEPEHVINPAPSRSSEPTAAPRRRGTAKLLPPYCAAGASVRTSRVRVCTSVLRERGQVRWAVWCAAWS